MEDFNAFKYSKIDDNKILKVKLASEAEAFLAKRIYKNVLQAYQPSFTPITKVNIVKIIDIELYKVKNNVYENEAEIQVEPTEIENVEIIDL